MKLDARKAVIASATAISIGLFGCGGPASTETTSAGTESEATEASEEEAAAADTKEPREDFEDVILVDNDDLTITLESLYREANEYSNVGEVTQDCISLKIASKGRRLSVFTDAYLDDEELHCALYESGSTVEAGKKSSALYIVQKDTKPDPTPLDSFDDLRDVELMFDVRGEGDDGYYTEVGTFDVRLGDAIDGGQPAGGEASGDAASEDGSKEAESQDAKPLGEGDVVATDDWEITYVGAEVTDEVLPADTSGVYASFEAAEGTKIANLKFDVKCLASEATALSDALSGGKVTYADKYTYDTTEVYYDGGDRVVTAKRLGLDPLQTLRIDYMLCNLPEDADTSGEPIVAEITVAGEPMRITVR